MDARSAGCYLPHRVCARAHCRDGANRLASLHERIERRIRIIAEPEIAIHKLYLDTATRVDPVWGRNRVGAAVHSAEYFHTMKLAKFWKKIEFPVDKELFFGRSVASVWGASNESAADAEIHAQSRQAQLRTMMEKGFRNGDYLYWNGYVREEVVEEIQTAHGAPVAILTRNHYGATVLNAERVVFGDIDVVVDTSFKQRILEKFGKRRRDKAYFLDRIRDYQISHPDLSFRVYETLCGLRFVLTSGTLDAADSRVRELFDALNVDRMYTQLCEHQQCFRARLTPKPWRIGLPRPASKFPRAERKDVDEFDSWLRSYEATRSSWTAVRLLESFGSAPIPAEIQAVIDVHDKHACQVGRELA